MASPSPAVTTTCQHIRDTSLPRCGGSSDIDWFGPGLFGYNLITTVIAGILLLLLLIFLMTRKGGWPPDKPSGRR